MPANRGSGKNMNIGNQEIVGDSKEEYNISKALKEVSKVLGDVQKEFKDMNKHLSETAKQVDGATKQIKEQAQSYNDVFNAQKKVLNAEKESYDLERKYAKLRKDVRTSDARANLDRQKQLDEELRKLKKINDILNNRKNFKENGQGGFKFVGDKNSEEGQLLSKEFSNLNNITERELKALMRRNYASQNSYNEELLDLQEKFGKQNVSVATKALDGFKNAGLKILGELKNEFTKGLNDFGNSYEANFTKLAGVTNTGGDRSATRQIFKDARSASKEYGASLNYNSDVLPQLQTLAEAGIQGQDLTARAITASVDNKILPWLKETDATWFDISNSMSDQTEAQYKNMQLSMQNSATGNRLLQSGVIEKLNSDIYPVLESIDFNTVDEGSIPQEMLALMDTYKQAGYSDQEAYQAAKDAYDISGNLYGALTSGDTSKIIQAQNQMQYGLGEGALKTANWAMEMASKSGSDVGASAEGNVLGTSRFFKGGRMTVDNARQLDEKAYEKSLSELQTASQSTDIYDKQKDNLDQFNTATQQFNNYIENFGSWVGELVSAIPGGQMLAGLAGDIIGEVGGEVLKKGVTGLGKSALGGVSGTALVGGGLLVAGGAMAIHDAIKGVKKADEWGTSKSSAGVASALFGSEEKPSLKNTGKQMAKYGAIGAGIGTFVGGPVGTLVGGAIGAGVGAVASLVNTKKVAEGLDKAKEGLKAAANTVKDNVKEKGVVGGALKTVGDALFGKDRDKKKEKKEADKQALKLAKAQGKGEKSIVSKILKAVLNIEKSFTKSDKSKTNTKTSIDNAKGKLENIGKLGKKAFDKTLLGKVAKGSGNLFEDLKNGEGEGSALGVSAVSALALSNPLIGAKRFLKGNSQNADEVREVKQYMSYGDTQIVETLKSVGQQIVDAINSNKTTKADIDYKNKLYADIGGGKVENSMTALQTDAINTSITA